MGSMRMSLHKTYHFRTPHKQNINTATTVFTRKERTFSAKGALLFRKKYGRFAQKVRTFLGKGTY